jgi:hypothetical protein
VETPAGDSDGFMNVFRNRWIQLSALTALIAGIGINALRLKFCVRDSDIWWHLKVGDWIIEHFALPHTGILSRTVADRPWVAYSWGYEVLLSRAYAWFGLLGIGLYGVVLTIGVAVASFWMLRRLSGRFWPAYLLTGIVCLAFLFNGMPRPVNFSQILYCVTLALILQAQRTGSVRVLYWLPLVFFFWANLHIQFIYGLFALGLFVGVNLVQRMLRSFGLRSDFVLETVLPLNLLLAVLAASFAATMIGPNLYHPYVVVLEYTKAKFPYSVIIELQPLTFTHYSHFLELFIGAAGFYAVGWQKKLDLFKLALLTVASVVAYRTMRDAWFICLSAAACIADFPVSKESLESRKEWTNGWRELAGVSAGVVLLLLIVAPAVDFNSRGLDRAISNDFPVNAINYLRRNPVPGPLYNNLNWGGFLMWYLPELPVSIDGRNDLYGDKLDELFYDTQSAFPSYATDPYLDQAGVVVLDSTLPLAKVLTIDPRFRLIYQDKIATVFTRR